MRTISQSVDDFFVVGGSLRPNAASYVTRPADFELVKQIQLGNFCFVLTPRQMGKSSLMLRTAAYLRVQHVRSAVVDLNLLGTILTIDQWYLGILRSIGEGLDLELDYANWWQAQATLGPVERFVRFLRDVILEQVSENVVIFVDEIDSTLSLPFDVDDFFAAIRAIYNARSNNPVYNRLTFCLLGVATPTDLIRDQRRTPFNIGQDIRLQEFSYQDANVFQRKLEDLCPGKGASIYERVLFWTDGHPYLTQRICLAIAQDPNEDWDVTKIDALVSNLFLLAKAARTETNLQSMQNSIVNRPDSRRLMLLYQQVYLQQAPKNDDHDLLQNQLKLIGLIRTKDDVLTIRNEIYRQVFDLKWITENMPPPPDSARRTIIALATAFLVLIVLLLVPVVGNMRVPWNPKFIQARTLQENVVRSSSADAQIANLARLVQTGYKDIALETFLSEFTVPQQVLLFTNANITQSGSDVTTVATLLYDHVNADVQMAILAKLLESQDYRVQAKDLLDKMPLSAQLDLFGNAKMEIVGVQTEAVLLGLAHSAKDETRMAGLGALLRGARTDAVLRLVRQELTPEERSVLFQNVDASIVGNEIVQVAKAILVHLANTKDDNKLLTDIARALLRADRPEGNALAQMIDLWLKARSEYGMGNNEKALTMLSQVIDANPNIVQAYYDRALVYIELLKPTEALKDLNSVVQRDKTLGRAVTSVVLNNPILANTWLQSANKYIPLNATIPSLHPLFALTNIAIQAVTEQTTTMSINFYGDKGTQACPPQTYDLSYGYSVDANMACYGVASGLATANRQIAGITVISNTVVGDVIEQAALTNDTAPSGVFYLPIVFAAGIQDFHNSSIAVMNAYSAPLTTTVTILNIDGTVLSQDAIELKVNEGVRVPVLERQLADNSDYWYGSARVSATGDGRVVGSMLGCQGLSCSASEGIHLGDMRWFAPGLTNTKGDEGKPSAFSVISIMNIDEQAVAHVSVTIPQFYLDKVFTLPPLGTVHLSTSDLPEISAEATAEIRSDSAMVAVAVQYMNVAANQAAIYNGLAENQGGRSLFFPQIQLSSDNNAETDIFLQNLTEREFTPTLSFFRAITDTKAPQEPPIRIQLEPLKAYGTATIDVQDFFREREHGMERIGRHSRRRSDGGCHNHQNGRG